MIDTREDESTSISSEESRRDKDAFLGLLELAESIYAQKKRLQRQYSFLFGVTALFSGVLGALVGASIKLGASSLIASPTLFFMTFPFVILVYLVSAYVIVNLRNQAVRESRAFEEVVAILHEVYASARRDMTILEVAQVRIRLSRIDN